MVWLAMQKKLQLPLKELLLPCVINGVYMYKVLIYSQASDQIWIEKQFEDVVQALQSVRIHHHTRLVYPCGSVAEYIQGSLIDLR